MRFFRKHSGFDLYIGDYIIGWIPPWSKTFYAWDITWSPLRIWLSQNGKLVWGNWKQEEDNAEF